MTYLKKTLPLACLFIVIPNIGVYAHSGRTDSQGGHNDRINGGYHFHHGEGPHQHINGICPYRDQSSFEIPPLVFDLLSFVLAVLIGTLIFILVIEQSLPEDVSAKKHFLKRALQVSVFFAVIEVIRYLF
jgi:hypothetical protein